MTSELAQFLQDAFTPRQYGKGDIIVRQGQICKELFFVQKGLLKVLSVNDGREFIMRFFAEDVFVTIVDSFTEQKPSKFEMVALEDSDLLVIHHSRFEPMVSANLDLANAFRQLNQWVSAQMVKRICEVLENDATKRYQKFVAENPALINRLALGEIAKYVGITQVSLSRIRAQKMICSLLKQSVVFFKTTKPCQSKLLPVSSPVNANSTARKPPVVNTMIFRSLNIT
jgi:CRP-like cAMP-binding protein